MALLPVSVVIPMYNEEKDIGDCLRSLKKQTYPHIEVILVDDGSTDSTINNAKKTAKEIGLRIKILNQRHGGPGLARNLGVNESKGKIIVFVDSDMTFDKDYIKNLVSPIKGEVIGTTHDNEIVLNTKNIWSACWGGIRVSPKDASKVKIFRAIRRDKFLELGGFDPKYGYADDQTLWFKHKVKPRVAKLTICYHKNPEKLKQVFSQSRWIGASLELPLMNKPILSEIVLVFAIVLSPVFVAFLSIMKCIKLKRPLLFPAMILFMIARYTGTLAGIFRSRYMKINCR